MALDELVHQVKTTMGMPELACIGAGFCKGYGEATGITIPSAEIGVAATSVASMLRGLLVGLTNGVEPGNDTAYLVASSAKGFLQGGFLAAVSLGAGYGIGYSAGYFSK